jgi:CRISPR/Cas system-associated endoribonuclease Cas2
MALTVVIAYDICDDKRRARLAATLQRGGDRVQRSVLVCTLEHDDLVSVAARLIRTGRTWRLRLDRDWPWATHLATAFNRIRAAPWPA